MKTRALRVGCMAAICCGCVARAWAMEIPLTASTPDAVAIVLPAKALGVEEYAAEELQYHLKRASGVTVAIVHEGDGAHATFRFYIGATEAAKAAGLRDQPYADDERRLKSIPGGVAFLGGDSPGAKHSVPSLWSPAARGTLYAVYDYLENELGVRWLWPGEVGTYVPRRTTLPDAPIDRAGIEPLAMRFWHGLGGADEKQMYGWTDVAARAKFHAEQNKFMLRHRCGMRIRYLRMGHAFGKYVERFFDTHPEYFQLKPDGTRGPWHPDKDGWNCSMCVSNPDLPRLVVDEWYAAYSKAKGKGRFPVLPFVNACENDTPGACRCAKCRSWDGPDPRFKQNAYWNGSRDQEPEMSSGLGIYGRLADMNRWGESAIKPPTPYSANVSDRYAKFYNAVLAEARTRAPEARVVAYAYQNYLEGPMVTKVDPGVMIEYVPRMYLPYDRDESDFLRLGWTNWRKAGVKDLIFRPNFTHAFGGFLVDQARQYCEDLAWCSERGLYGIALDSQMGAYSAQTMHNYAITRSFREPTRGYAKARADMLLAFGSAQKEVNRYFDLLEGHSRQWTHESFEKLRQANPLKNGIFGGGFHRQIFILGDFYSEEFLRQCHDTLEAAMRAAANDAEVLARIKFLKMGLGNTILTRRTRLAMKEMDAAPNDAAKKAKFEEAFAKMNKLRTEFQFDCFLNLHREAIHEMRQANWPHKPITVETAHK